MILLELEKEKYTINDDFMVEPKNNIIEDALISSLDLYNSPAQGFKTSFVADKLKSMGFEVLDVYDKEMEDAPNGVVY